MAGPFSETNLTADQFKPAFEQLVLARYHGAWTLFAETTRGFLPVGLVFAFFSHHDQALSPFMILGDVIWFPWATSRNKIESAVGFFSKIRKEIPMMGYAHGDMDRKFFECLCKHAIMQRVGTTFNVIRGKAVAIFETMAR